MASSSAASNNLVKLLTTPGKIARSLDWKKQTGSLLSVHIGKKSIDLAVTSHPSAFHPIQPLPTIPIEFETRQNRKVMKGNVLLELSSIVQDYKVCGLVVSWPVQKEGWCGATCGMVLHSLDQIIQDTTIVTPNRPVCLWDGHHFVNPEDEWGRVALYSVPSAQDRHVASVEQYRDEGMMAADIAADYLRFHWPELSHNLMQTRASTRSLISADLERFVERKRSHA